jgi:hypothetical protein
MSFTSRLVIGGVVAGAALTYYIRRRHARTGESYIEILAQLPTLARDSAEDIRRRALAALEDGRAAARAREEEFTRQLEAPTAPSSAGASPADW